MQAWLLAALVALAPVGPWAYLALGVTVVAEINLSLLFAPAAQPLLSATVSADQRQRMNSRVRAVAVVVVATGLLLFGVLTPIQRSVFLGLVGLAALAVTAILGGISPPKTIDSGPTSEDGAGVLLAAVVLALLQAPVTETLGQVAILVSLFGSSFSVTFVRLASLELIHRLTDETSSVQSFTLLDVIASTSLQVGLWAGGLLIVLSDRYPTWPLDAYRLYLLVVALAASWAIRRLQDR